LDAPLLAFYGLAGIGLAAAVLMVTRRNLVHAALYLLVTFFAVAGIFVLLQAEFLAAVQVLVYAGGIMVLYLFVILLVDVPREEAERPLPRRTHTWVASVLTLATAGLVVWNLAARPAGPAAPGRGPGGDGNLETVAMALFRHYVLPFEAVSVLLLVAMIAAIVLARPERGAEGAGR